MNEKTIELFGKENFEKIANSNICIVGIGGVGGFVVENLVRTGIENLTIIDFDIVDKSNLNRQIIATTKTVGKPKVEVMKSRILEINPACKVKIFNEKICSENLEKFKLKNFDFVVDCIDIITDKIALIVYCKNNNINIVSALGAGNRFGVPDFQIIDIYKTQNDGLAKALRKKLRENGVKNLPCVCSCAMPDVKLQNPASVMWQPCVCGCFLACYVVNELIKANKN